MKQEYFYPHVWEKIKDFLTPEKAEEAKFKVSTMKITPELAEKIYKYISEQKIETYMQSTKNGRQVRFSYTPHFSVKMYIKYDGSYSMCLIDSGAQGDYKRGRRQAEFNEKKERSMTKLEIYFSIIKKYPNHLLDISCYTDDDVTWLAKREG